MRYKRAGKLNNISEDGNKLLPYCCQEKIVDLSKCKLIVELNLAIILIIK